MVRQKGTGTTFCWAAEAFCWRCQLGGNPGHGSAFIGGRRGLFKVLQHGQFGLAVRAAGQVRRCFRVGGRVVHHPLQRFQRQAFFGFGCCFLPHL